MRFAAPHGSGTLVKVLARTALSVFAFVVVLLAAELPGHAAESPSPEPVALASPSTGLNVLIAAGIGLAAGGVTFYLRTRGRRGDRD
ncbi:hypothetical protein AB0I28_14630 [Phytomonospora sp. NPDC050363]|uniref:hypothetical protein n=1 Tax=Phytomonospora sp. NPDC050363 TaxID=3155642 RepID=UPI00340CEBE8